MEVVCKCLGGSHSYGLNTKDSDTDIRGVFLNTDFKHILGLEDHNHQKEKEGDVMMYELRRFVELLRNGNTGALEILFNKNLIEVSPQFKFDFLDAGHGIKFVDSIKLHKCLKGYAQHELRLAMGLRPGEIGFKRYESVKKYGFSPKNFTQLFRLMMVGEHFFQTGEFIVDCRDFPDKEYHPFLMRVKTDPESYSLGYLRELFSTYEQKLDTAFANRTKTITFDHQYATEALFMAYFPALSTKHEELCHTYAYAG